MSIYIVVGVHYEERALVRELGLSYVDYRSSTPKFLPGGTRTAARPAPAATP
jgi:protein-S-isoprenylcysteine O-methyltransferase Ste14